MKALFDRWGWVSFLSYIAESRMFDVPGNGLNSIQNAKRAKLYEVFVYASEKKDADEIINEYYQNQKR